MNIVLWMLIGALAGWLADIITRPDVGLGRGTNIAIGIIGALVGGWVTTLFGFAGVTGFDLYGFLVAALSAMSFVGLAQVFQRPVLR